MNRRDAYLKTRVLTASPGELVVMLYDGLLRFLGEAEAAIRDEDPAKAGKANARALGILEHLLESLRPEKAPDLANHLQNLYLLWTKTVVRALAERDADSFEQVRGQVAEMRDAWNEASRRVEEKSA